MLGDKLINPIVGVYIPIIASPIKGEMTIPNIGSGSTLAHLVSSKFPQIQIAQVHQFGLSNLRWGDTFVTRHQHGARFGGKHWFFVCSKLTELGFYFNIATGDHYLAPIKTM